MTNLRRILALTACLAACLTAGACTLGPAAMPANRMEYNLSAQRSAHEQMLLNLVRVKYLENPLFMQVGTIASSFSFSANAGAIINASPDSHQFPLGASVTESPTITYTPYDGQKYTQEIMSEISGPRLLMLYRTNTDLEVLLRCVVDRIGALENQAPGRPVDPKRLAAFNRFCRQARDMQIRRDLELVSVAAPKPADKDADKDPPANIMLVLRFRDREQAKAMADTLGAGFRPVPRPGGELLLVYRFVDTNLMEISQSPDPHYLHLPVRLRSCREVLDYLGQGVETPPQHRSAGVAGHPADADRKALVDPQPLVEELFRVRQSPERPANAFVSVFYRNTWFYLDDADLRSKQVFSLMITLMALQSSAPSAPAPVLTLSVGAN
ncbi:MAG: hypothetical protein ACOZHQ_03695 [Thermodesulfobacteriota bacterium]